MITYITVGLAALMFVVVLVLHVWNIVTARRLVKRLESALLEARMKPFSSYKDNRKRQKAIEQAATYRVTARVNLSRQKWTLAIMNAERGIAVLRQVETEA